MYSLLQSLCTECNTTSCICINLYTDSQTHPKSEMTLLDSTVLVDNETQDNLLTSEDDIAFTSFTSCDSDAYDKDTLFRVTHKTLLVVYTMYQLYVILYMILLHLACRPMTIC